MEEFKILNRSVFIPMDIKLSASDRNILTLPEWTKMFATCTFAEVS